MQESITIKGTTVHIGNKLRANKNAEIRGICSSDEIVEIKAIKQEDHIYIGLYSEQKHRAWGGLDGCVDSYHGFWQAADGLFNFFDLIHSEKVVVGDFDFKKRNLKGMRCKILYQNHREGQCFVELADDVGGGSADGLGKSGHCVILSSSLLENVDSAKVSKTKAKKKAIESVIEKLEADVPEIAIKAKMATKQANKEGIDKYTASDISWEKMQKDLWSVETKAEFKKDFVMEWKVGNASKDKPIEVVGGGYIDFGEEPDSYDES